VYYSGQVQGVGFRATAASLASGFEVTGMVRNLPDGRVELVVEGARDQIDRFLERIDREFRGYIRQRSVTTAPCVGEFRRFEIRI